nr:coiled-coil domain-containing protein lobo-like [Megalopta genalis]
MSNNNEEVEFGSGESRTTFTETDAEHDTDKLSRTVISYTEITPGLIKEAQQELGMIKLCWPETDPREDVYLRTLPRGYRTVSDKEKVAAWYAENFRRQFHTRYPDRKPLLLVCENECGVQGIIDQHTRFAGVDVCSNGKPDSFRNTEKKMIAGTKENKLFDEEC